MPDTAASPARRSLLSPALIYGRFQTSIIPLQPRGKKAAIKRWTPYQTERASADQITRWWTANPEANIGLICGAISDLFVMDVDDEDALPALKDAGFPLDTMRVRTSKGLHFYYKYPGYNIPTVKQCLPGIDVRGDGGYVAAPPSEHESGHIYATVDGDYPMRGKLADASDAAFELFRPDRAPIEKVQYTGQGVGLISDRTQAFLDNGAVEPHRNSELFAAACDMAGCGYDPVALTDTLLGVTAGIGYNDDFTENECRASIMSALKQKRDPTSKVRNRTKPPMRVEEIREDIESPPVVRDSGGVLSWEEQRQDIVGGGFSKENPFRAPKCAEALASCFHFLTRPGDGDSGGILYHYADGVYLPNGIGVAEKYIYDLLGEHASPHRIKSIIDLLKILTRVEGYDDRVDDGRMKPDDDAYTWINVENGIVNRKTYELVPHTPEFKSTIQIAAPYEEKPATAFIERFWSMCIPEDSRMLAMQILGYLLIPTTRHERAFLIVGPQGTGKSRFIEMCGMLLGEANVSHTDLKTVSDSRYGAHDLVGKLTNLGDDLQASVIEDSSTFKRMVSGIRMRAEQKFQAAFSFRPTARLLFTANQIPRSRDKDDAWYIRWVILPFTRVVRGTTDEIKAEEFNERVHRQRAGLLSFALKGLEFLEKQGGFIESEAARGQKDRMQRENDPIYAFFADHCEFCSVPAVTLATGAQSAREKYTVGKDEFYGGFVRWCDYEGFKYPPKRAEFNLAVSNRANIIEAKGTERDGALLNRRIWRGVEMLDLRSGEEHHDEEPF